MRRPTEYDLLKRSDIALKRRNVRSTSKEVVGMSEEAKTTGHGFGRRTFLKGSAATMGLAALAGTGCAPREELGSLA